MNLELWSKMKLMALEIFGVKQVDDFKLECLKCYNVWL